LKNKIVGVLLLSLQLYLVVLGRDVFDKYSNAILFFIVSLTIPIYLFQISRHKNPVQPKAHSNTIYANLFWSLMGCISVLLTYEELRKNFVAFRDFQNYSDVIPQAITLYDRFVHGQFPYHPISFGAYSLDPIYFPFHWLPVFFSRLWPLDVRWTGWGIFVLIAGLYGWKIKSLTSQKAALAIALICPSLVLWAYIVWTKAELSVTFEIVIGAYYLLLGAGLITKNYWLIGIGIVCCLLSRFTLVFWLPFFAFLLRKDVGLKKSVLFWSLVLVALLGFFFVPFYFKDPQFIVRGMAHYVNATIGDWMGSGNPPVSWTQENGISIAPIFNAILSGEIPYKVHITQLIQSIVMILTLVAAFWVYKKWSKQISTHLFMLLSLDVFLLMYYFFAPLTYRSYLFSFLIISSLLCVMIITSNTNGKNDMPVKPDPAISL